MNEKALDLSNIFMYLYFEYRDEHPLFANWCYEQYQKYSREVLR